MIPITGHESISRTTLEGTEARAVKFLKAAGTRPRLRAALEAAGYGKAVHAAGFRLYFKVVGFSPTFEAPVTSPSIAAFEELEAWEPEGFARARAALRHSHAEAEQFVFADLAAEKGPAALGAMAAFLDRCDALGASPARKATRKADKAALATLEARGITKALRRDLRKKLALASIEADAGTTGEIAPEATLQRREDLYALYLWLQDWSGTARAVIKSRTDLIALGLLRRRAKRADAPAPAPAQPAPAPAQPAPSIAENGPSSRAA